MPDGPTVADWATVDGFWDAFEADHELSLSREHVQALDTRPRRDAWNDVDEFWERYVDPRETALKELRELLSRLDAMWREGGGPFESDPFSTNWRAETQYEGPLRGTADEEDWSQWLAHLLRTSTGAFPQALLGAPNRAPDRVRREIEFQGQNRTRRADILVEYPETAFSIEVKNGDDNYGKTPETASFIELDARRDWSHTLLLQRTRLPRLRRTFPDQLSNETAAQLQLASDDYPVVDVRYWRDVSRLLRHLLVDGREPDTHWQASAYVFITLVEQRILGLQPRSFIDPSTAATDTKPDASTTTTATSGDGTDTESTTTDYHRLAGADLREQIEYVEFVLREDHEL